MAGEIKKCACCGDVFQARRKDQIYCSSACNMRANHKPLPEVKKCEECGKNFKPRNITQKFCGEKCVTASYNRRRREKREKADHETKQCVVCGKEFVQASYRQLCCSKECGDKYKSKSRRKTQPIELKKKMSPLAEINELARNAGMNYGMYVGIMGL